MWCNLDSTSACGAGGCGFKSRHARSILFTPARCALSTARFSAVHTRVTRCAVGSFSNSLALADTVIFRSKGLYATSTPGSYAPGVPNARFASLSEAARSIAILVDTAILGINARAYLAVRVRTVRRLQLYVLADHFHLLQRAISETRGPNHSPVQHKLRNPYKHGCYSIIPASRFYKRRLQYFCEPTCFCLRDGKLACT